MAFSSGGTLAVPMLGRIRAWYSSSLYRIDQCCSRAAVENRWHPLCRSGQRLLRSTLIPDLWQRHSTMRRGLLCRPRNVGRARYATHITPHAIGEQNIYHAVTLDTQQMNSEDRAMDKDRIKGSAEQAKGAVKETVGKVFGDKKLETAGKADQAAGKLQNA